MILDLLCIAIPVLLVAIIGHSRAARHAHRLERREWRRIDAHLREIERDTERRRNAE